MKRIIEIIINVCKSYRRMPVSPCTRTSYRRMPVSPTFGSLRGIAGQARNDDTAKSRRDDTLLTTLLLKPCTRTSYRRMPVSPTFGSLRGIAGQARNDDTAKSRRDDTLLTVGFNLRKQTNVHARQSPAGTTLCRGVQVSSLQDFGAYAACPVRRLIREDKPKTTMLLRGLPKNKGFEQKSKIENQNLIVQNRDLTRHSSMIIKHADYQPHRTIKENLIVQNADLTRDLIENQKSKIENRKPLFSNSPLNRIMAATHTPLIPLSRHINKGTKRSVLTKVIREDVPETTMLLRELQKNNGFNQKSKIENRKSTIKNQKSKIKNWLKIAALIAVMVIGSSEAWGQRLEGMQTVAINGVNVDRYFGYTNARPWSTTALPAAGLNNSTATNGLMVNPGTIVQVQCATRTSGAIFELQGFAIGTPGTQANQFTGSLFTNGSAPSDTWRIRFNHATNLGTGHGLMDGAIWLVVNWGEGPVFYELTLNSQWQLVPRHGIFYRYNVNATPPCSYTFTHLRVVGIRCTGTVTGNGWNRSCSSASGETSYIADLKIYSGMPQTVNVNNLQKDDIQNDNDVLLLVDNNVASNVTQYTICVGDVTGRNFTDMTRTNCAGDRYVQFEYRYYTAGGGSGNITIANAPTGGVTVATIAGNATGSNIWRDGGTANTASGSRRVVQVPNSNISNRSQAQSNFVRLPSTARNGDYVEVTMYTWNSCNGPIPGTTPDNTDRGRAIVRRARINVTAPTQVLDNKTLDFCFQQGVVNNYNTPMTSGGVAPSQAASYRYYTNTTGTGTYFTNPGGGNLFDPSSTIANYVPAGSRLVGNGTAAERNRTYSVRYVTTAGCESAPATLTFRVRDNISQAPVITGPTTVCEGETYRFHAPANTSTDPVTYVWLNGTGYEIVATQGGGTNRTGTWADIRFTAAAQIRMYRMWTTPVNTPPSSCTNTPPAAADMPPGVTVGCQHCFSATATHSVTMNTIPMATLSGGGTICANDPRQLNISGLTGATGANQTYTVTVSGTGGYEHTSPPFSGGYQLTVNPASGTHEYRITSISASGNSCTNTTAQPVVTVIKRPLLSLDGRTITTSPTPLCEGADFTATVAGITVGADAELVWTYNGVNQTNVNNNSATYPAGIATTGRPIEVFWRYTNPTEDGGANHCPSGSINANLTISAAPTVTIVPASQTQAICAGDGANVSINLSGGTPGNSFTLTWELLNEAGNRIGVIQTATIASTVTSPSIEIPASMLSGAGIYTFKILTIERVGSCTQTTAPTATATIIVERVPTAVFKGDLAVATCENIPYRATLSLTGEPGRAFFVEYRIGTETQLPLEVPPSTTVDFDFEFTIPATHVNVGTVTIQIISVRQEGGRACSNANQPLPLVLNVSAVLTADPNITGKPYSVCVATFDGSTHSIPLHGNRPAGYNGRWTLAGSTVPLPPHPDFPTDPTQALITSVTPDLYTVEWRIWSGTDEGCYSSRTAQVFFAASNTTAEVFTPQDEECFGEPYELRAIRPSPVETGWWQLWEIELQDGTEYKYHGNTWWTVTSVLPPGLSLNASTGIISGRPRTPGTYTFTLTGFNASNVAVTTVPHTIQIVHAVETVPPPAGSTPNGQVGTLYNFTLPTVAGVARWEVTSLMPAGLELNSETGLISGTPTTTGSFTITETNIKGNNVQTTITITSTQVNQPYTRQLTPSYAKTPIPDDWGAIEDTLDFRTGVNINLNELGRYTFRWTVAGGCDVVSDFTTITFLPKPIVQQIEKIELCAQSLIEMPRFRTVTEIGGAPINDTGFAYRWQFASTPPMDGFDNDWHDGQFPPGRTTPLTASTAWEQYRIGVEVSNGSCWSDRMIIDIDLKPKPKDIQLSVSELCSGEEVTMELKDNMWQNTTYNWTITTPVHDFIVPLNNDNYTAFAPADGSDPAVLGKYVAGDEVPPFSFRFETKNDNSNIPIVANIATTATVNDCTSEVYNLALTINPRPRLSLPTHSGDEYIIENCPYVAGERTNITAAQTTIASSVTGTEYTWLWNGNNEIGFNLPATVAGEDYTLANTLGAFTPIDNITTGRLGGTMTVTGATHGCQSEPVSFQFWIKPRPDIRPPTMQTLCPTPEVGGAFPAFTFRSSNLPDEQVNYTWTVTPPAATGLPAVTGNASAPPEGARKFADNTSNTNHVYVWTVTATGNAEGQGHADGCATTLEPPLTMSVFSRPVINIINTNDAVCSGNFGDPLETISFNTTPLTSTFVWNISQPENNTSTGAASLWGMGSSIEFSRLPLNTSTELLYEATITVNATSTDGCVADEKPTKIAVKQEPVVVAPDPIELCSGETQPAIPLSVSNNADIGSYSWKILNPELVKNWGAESSVSHSIRVGTGAAGTIESGAVDVFYEYSLGVTWWRITSGALPAGLFLNEATGVISGTPTAAGIFNFTITGSNGGSTLSNPSAISAFKVGDNTTNARLTTEIEVWATHDNGCPSEPVRFPVNIRPEIRITSNIDPITVCPDDWVSIPLFTTNTYGSDASIISWTYTPAVAGTDVSEGNVFTNGEEDDGTPIIRNRGAGNITNFFATKNDAPSTNAITGTFRVTAGSHWSETNQTCESATETIVVTVNPTPAAPVYLHDDGNDALPLFFCHSEDEHLIGFETPEDAFLTWASNVPELTGGNLSGNGITGDDGWYVAFAPVNNSQQMLFERGTSITVWSNMGEGTSVCRSLPLEVDIIIRPTPQMIETFPIIIEDCSGEDFEIPEFLLHNWFTTEGHITDKDHPDYEERIRPQYFWSIAPVLGDEETETNNWTTGTTIFPSGRPPMGAPTFDLAALSPMPYTFKPVITGTGTRELTLTVTPWFDGCEGEKITTPIVINPTPNVLVQIAGLYSNEPTDLATITAPIEICSFTRFEDIHLSSGAGTVDFRWNIDINTLPTVAMAEGTRFIGNVFSNSDETGVTNNLINFRPAFQQFAANTLYPDGLEATVTVSARVAATGCSSGAALPLNLTVLQAPELVTTLLTEVEACSEEKNVARTLNVALDFANNPVPVQRYEWFSVGNIVWDDDTKLWSAAAPGFIQIDETAEPPEEPWIVAQEFKFNAALNTGNTDLEATLNFRAQHGVTGCWSANTARPVYGTLDIAVRPQPRMTSTHVNLTVCPGETVGGGTTNNIVANRFNPFTAGPAASDAYVHWVFDGDSDDIFIDADMKPGQNRDDYQNGAAGNLIGHFTTKVHTGDVETGVFLLYPRIPKRDLSGFCPAPAAGNASITITLNPTPVLTKPADVLVCENTRVPATGDFVFTSSRDNTVFRWQSYGSSEIGWSGSDGEQSVPGTGTAGRQFSIPAFTAMNGTVQSGFGTRLETGEATITVTALAGEGKLCASQEQTVTIEVKPVPQITPVTPTQICTGEQFAGVTFEMLTGFDPYEDDVDEAVFYWYMRLLDGSLEYETVPATNPLTIFPQLTGTINLANLRNNASVASVPAFRADIDPAFTGANTRTMTVRAIPYHDGCLGDHIDVVYTVVQRPGFIAGFAPQDITVCSGETIGGDDGIELKTITGAIINWSITQAYDAANQGYIGRGATFGGVGNNAELSNPAGFTDDNVTIKFEPSLNIFTGAQTGVREEYYFTAPMSVRAISPIMPTCSTTTNVMLRVGQAPVLDVLAIPQIVACAGEEFEYDANAADNTALPLTTSNPATTPPSAPIEIDGIRWTLTGDEVWNNLANGVIHNVPAAQVAQTVYVRDFAAVNPTNATPWAANIAFAVRHSETGCWSNSSTNDPRVLALSVRPQPSITLTSHVGNDPPTFYCPATTVGSNPLTGEAAVRFTTTTFDNEVVHWRLDNHSIFSTVDIATGGATALDGAARTGIGNINRFITSANTDGVDNSGQFTARARIPRTLHNLDATKHNAYCESAPTTFTIAVRPTPEKPAFMAYGATPPADLSLPVALTPDYCHSTTEQVPIHSFKTSLINKTVSPETTAWYHTGNSSATTFVWDIVNNPDNTSQTSADIGIPTPSGSAIPQFLPTNTGSETVTAWVSVTAEMHGCPSEPYTFAISVKPTPKMATGYSTALVVCSNSQAVIPAFALSTTAPGYPAADAVYNWYITGTETWAANATGLPSPLYTLPTAASPNNAAVGAFNTDTPPAHVFTPIINSGESTENIQRTMTLWVRPTHAGCTGDFEAKTITINPRPEIDVVAFENIICAGDKFGDGKIEFSSDVTTGTNTFTWAITGLNGTGDTGRGDATAANLTGTITGSDGEITFDNARNTTQARYTATLNITASSTQATTNSTACTAGFSTLFTVLQEAVVQPFIFAATTTEACANETFNIPLEISNTLTGGVSLTRYDWTTTNETIWTSAGTTPAATPTLTFTTADNTTTAGIPATVSVRAIATHILEDNETKPCTSTQAAPFNLVLRPRPIITITTGNIPDICPETTLENPITFAEANDLAGTTFHWELNNPAIFSAITPAGTVTGGGIRSGDGNITSFTAAPNNSATTHDYTTPFTGTFTVEAHIPRDLHTFFSSTDYPRYCASTNDVSRSVTVKPTPDQPTIFDFEYASPPSTLPTLSSLLNNPFCPNDRVPSFLFQTAIGTTEYNSTNANIVFYWSVETPTDNIGLPDAAVTGALPGFIGTTNNFTSYTVGDLPSFIATNTTTGDYSATVRFYARVNDCYSEMNEHTIEVFPYPQMQKPPDIDHCGGSSTLIGSAEFTLIDGFEGTPTPTFDWEIIEKYDAIELFTSATGATDVRLPQSGTGSSPPPFGLPPFRPAHTAVDIDEIVLRVTPSLNGCTGNPVTSHINIWRQPVIAFNYTDTEVEVCSGDSFDDITFSSSNVTTASLQWSIPAPPTSTGGGTITTGISSLTGSTGAITFGDALFTAPASALTPASSTYTETLTLTATYIPASTSLTCRGTEELELTVLQTTVIDQTLLVPIEACANEKVSGIPLGVTNNVTVGKYSWTIDQPANWDVSANEVTASPWQIADFKALNTSTAGANQTATITVTATHSETECQSSASFVLTVRPEPLITSTHNDIDPVCPTQLIVIPNFTTNSGAGLTGITTPWTLTHNAHGVLNTTIPTSGTSHITASSAAGANSTGHNIVGTFEARAQISKTTPTTYAPATVCESAEPVIFTATVKPTPDAPAIIDLTNAKFEFCSGETATDYNFFTGFANNSARQNLNTGTAGVNFDWTRVATSDLIGYDASGDGNLTGVTVRHPDATPYRLTPSAATFNVRATVDGCESAWSNNLLTVTVKPVPQLPDDFKLEDIDYGCSNTLLTFNEFDLHGGFAKKANIEPVYQWNINQIGSWLGLDPVGRYDLNAAAPTGVTWNPLGFSEGATDIIPPFTVTTPQQGALVVRQLAVRVTPWYDGCEGVEASMTINIAPTPTIEGFEHLITCSDNAFDVINLTSNVDGVEFVWAIDADAPTAQRRIAETLSGTTGGMIDLADPANTGTRILPLNTTLSQPQYTGDITVKVFHNSYNLCEFELTRALTVLQAPVMTTPLLNLELCSEETYPDYPLSISNQAPLSAFRWDGFATNVWNPDENSIATTDRTGFTMPVTAQPNTTGANRPLTTGNVYAVATHTLPDPNSNDTPVPNLTFPCVSAPTEFSILLRPVPVIHPMAQFPLNFCPGQDVVVAPFETTPPALVKWAIDRPEIAYPPFDADPNHPVYDANIGTFAAANPNNTQTITGNFTATARLNKTAATGLAYCEGALTTLFSVTVDPAPTTPEFVDDIYEVAANRVFCDGQPIEAIEFQTSPATAVITWQRTGVNFGMIDESLEVSTMGEAKIPDFTARNFTADRFTQGVSTITVRASIDGRCTSPPFEFDLRVQPVPRVGDFGPVHVCSYLTDADNYTPDVFTFSTGFLAANPTMTATTAANFNWVIINHDDEFFAVDPGASANAAYLPTFRPDVTGSSPEVLNLRVTPVWTTGKECLGTPREFLLNLHPLPQIADIGKQELCSDSRFSNIIFTTSNNIASNYNWTVTPSKTPSTTENIGILDGILTNSTDRLVFPETSAAVNTTPAELTASVSVTATSNTAGACVNSRNFDALLAVFQRPIMKQPGNEFVCSGTLTTLDDFETENVDDAFISRYEWRTDKATTLGLGGASGAVINEAGTTFPALPPFTPQNPANNAGELVTIWVSATHATTLTDGTLCVSDEKSFTILVHRTPEINMLATAMEYCPEIEVGVDSPLPVFSINMDDATYSWEFNWETITGDVISELFEIETSGMGAFPNFWTRENNSTAANPNGTPIVGRFNIWAEIDYGAGPACGESVKREVTITVNPTPVTPYVNMTTPEFCHSNPVSTDAAPIVFQSLTTDPLTWTWRSVRDDDYNDIGQATTGVTSRITAFNATNNTPQQRDVGTASFYAVATSAKGCPSEESAPFNIVVKPVPQLDELYAIEPFCAYDEMLATDFNLEPDILANFPGAPPATFRWRIDERNYIPETNIAHPGTATEPVWRPGTQWVSVTPNIDTIHVMTMPGFNPGDPDIPVRFPNNVFRPDGSSAHPLWGTSQRTMTLLVEPTYAGCVGTIAYVPIVINPLPITNIIPNDIDDCVGSHGYKTYWADDGRQTPGIVSWLWEIEHDTDATDTPEVSVPNNPQGEHFTSLLFNDYLNMKEYGGTMHLTVTNEFTCWSETSLKITAVPVPRVRAAEEPLPLVLELCTDVETQLKGVFLNAADTYKNPENLTISWNGYNMPAYVQDGNVMNNRESLEPWISGNYDGEHTLRAAYTTANGACISEPSTLIINVNRSPDAPIIPMVVACEANDPLNSDFTMTVLNHTAGANTHYYWYRVEESLPGSGIFDVEHFVIDDVDLYTLDMINHLPTSPLTWEEAQIQMNIYYRVNRTQEINTRSGFTITCTSPPNVTELRVNRTPAMPDEGEFLYCENKAWPMYTLTTVARDNATAGFQWQRPDGTPLSPGNVVVVNQPGNSLEDNNDEPFMYRVRAISTFNCTSDFAQIPLTIHQNPILNFEMWDVKSGELIEPPVTNGCAPFDVLGKINSADPAIRYVWEWQSGYSDPASALSETPYTYRIGGTTPEVFRTRLVGISTVNLDMRPEIGYCQTDTLIQLVINPGVTAGFLASGFEGCHPTTVGFQNTSHGGFDFRWYWNTPGGVEPPYPGHANPALNRPVIQPNDPAHPGYEGARGPNISHLFTNETANPIRYHLWLQVDNGGCFDNKDTVITIYPVPKATFTHNLQGGSVCPPEIVEFYNTSTEIPEEALGNNSTTRYRWSYGNGFIETVRNTGDMQHAYQNWSSTMPIPYLVEMSAFNSHFIHAGRDTLVCMSTSSRQILVNPQVEARFDILGASEGCSPFYVEFMNQSIGSAPFSTWDFGDGSNNVTGRNPTHLFENQSLSAPQNLTVTLTAANNWCSNEETATIQLLPRPVASFELKDNNVSGCQPFPATFVNTSLSAGNPTNVRYFYDFGDFYILEDDQHTEEVTHTYTNTASENLQRFPTMTAISEWVVNGNNTIICASIPAQQNVTIFPFVKADFQYEIDGLNACSPATVNFLNGSQGFEDYTFNFGDQTIIGGVRDTSLHVVTHIFNTPTMFEDVVYTVELTVRAGICTDFVTDTIRILSQPIASFRTGNLTYPYPAPHITIDNLIPIESINELDYLWSWRPASSNYSNNFSIDPSPNPLLITDFGDFLITQRATAKNRICSDSQTIRISIVPPDVIPDFDEVFADCAPHSVTFVNQSRFSNNYVWDFGDGYTSNDENPKHTYMLPGTYQVVLTAYGESMIPRSFTREVNVIPTPQAGFELSSRYLYVGQSIQTKNQSVITTPDGTPMEVWYQWDFGDGTPISTEFEPAHYYMNSGKYNVTLTVGTVAEPQCSTTVTLNNVIEMDNAGYIVFPNIFRPDANGERADDVPTGGYRNFLFFPALLTPTVTYNMMIYNRLGVLMYETKDPDKGWNGYYNGKLCEEGVYAYKVEGVFLNGRTFFQSGTVLLVR